MSGHRRAGATAALAAAKPPRRHEEWEPSAALRSALEGLSLVPGASLDSDLARLKPRLEEAYGVLERLERQRGLSKREKTQKEAFNMLLASSERSE